MQYDDVPKCDDGTPDMESNEWNIFCGETFWGMFDDEIAPENECPHCHTGKMMMGEDGFYCSVCGLYEPIS